MTYFKLIIPTLLLVLMSATSVAQVATTHKQLKLSDLLELMRLDQSIEIGIAGCIEATLAGAYSPQQVLDKNGQYYGFTEKSSSWPSVQEAFKRYAIASCTQMTVEELRALYMDFYGTRVTEHDLDGMIAFMRSPAGQAFVSLQDEFVRTIGKKMQERAISVGVTAQAALESDLAKLKNSRDCRKRSSVAPQISQNGVAPSASCKN